MEIFTIVFPLCVSLPTPTLHPSGVSLLWFIVSEKEYDRMEI